MCLRIGTSDSVGSRCRALNLLLSPPFIIPTPHCPGEELFCYCNNLGGRFRYTCYGKHANYVWRIFSTVTSCVCIQKGLNCCLAKPCNLTLEYSCSYAAFCMNCFFLYFRFRKNVRSNMSNSFCFSEEYMWARFSENLTTLIISYSLTMCSKIHFTWGIYI